MKNEASGPMRESEVVDGIVRRMQEIGQDRERTTVTAAGNGGTPARKRKAAIRTSPPGDTDECTKPKDRRVSWNEGNVMQD